MTPQEAKKGFCGYEELEDNHNLKAGSESVRDIISLVEFTRTVSPKLLTGLANRRQLSITSIC